MLSDKIKKMSKDIEENTGFIPGTRDRMYSVILSFDGSPQDIFDAKLSQNEYKDENSFLDAILEGNNPSKILKLEKISVSQYYTSSEDQLVPFIKKNKGKWFFSR